MSDTKKILEKFEKNMKQVAAILAGQWPVKEPKLNKDEIDVAVETFTKDKKEQAIKNFVTDLNILVESYRNFMKETEAERKKFESIVVEKKKEMNTRFEALLKRVEDINSIEKSYLAILQDLSSPEGSITTENKEKEDEEEE